MNLQAAIRAARDESFERSEGPRTTRGRVLASIDRSPRRRVHAVVAAVIASMFGASAFAWYARTPTTPPAQAPVIVVEQGGLAPIEKPRSVERTIARVEPVAPAAEPAPARVAEPAPMRAPQLEAPLARDPELALYATAHALHFQQRDMAAALDAWNRYLAAAPAGSLAPEAHFNRLVALVKLERWDDAARELSTVDAAFRPADIARLRTLIEQHRR